jgi:hypothetical protein
MALKVMTVCLVSDVILSWAPHPARVRAKSGRRDGKLGNNASTLIPVPGTARLGIRRHARRSWLRSSNLSQNDNLGRFRTTPDVNRRVPNALGLANRIVTARSARRAVPKGRRVIPTCPRLYGVEVQHAA